MTRTGEHAAGIPGLRCFPLGQALAQGSIADFDFQDALVYVNVNSVAFMHRGNGSTQGSLGRDVSHHQAPGSAHLKRPSVSKATDPPGLRLQSAAAHTSHLAHAEHALQPSLQSPPRRRL